VVEIKVAEQQGSDLQCAFCHGHLPPLCTRCDDCGTRMHFACHTSLGRCPTLGCAGSSEEILLAPPPPEPGARSRRRRAVLLWELLRPVAFWATVGFVVVYAAIAPVHTPTPRTDVQADLLVLSDAINLYRANMNTQPKQLADLWERPADYRWRGPYLYEEPPLDPWGNPYVYRNYGAGVYGLVSYGADGSPGGAADSADIRHAVGFGRR
jgi:general secretion pathway protein G